MPDLTAGQWILGTLCALLVGFSKTGVAGFGVVVALLMTEVFPARQSTAAMLLILIIGDLFAIAYYRRHAVWHTLLSLLPWVVPGIVVGWLALGRMDDRQLKAVLGGLVLALIGLQLARTRLGEWFEQRLPHTWWFVALTGLAAGFATMIGNAAAPIMAVFLLARGLDKHAFMGTSAWFYFLINMTKVPFSAHLGLTNAETLTFAGLMAPAVTAGAMVGVRVLPLLPQRVFDRIVLALAAIASLRLVLSWP